MQERVVDIATHDGDMNTYIFHPVVIHYIDSVGVREELSDMCRRLARCPPNTARELGSSADSGSEPESERAARRGLQQPSRALASRVYAEVHDAKFRGLEHRALLRFDQHHILPDDVLELFAQRIGQPDVPRLPIARIAIEIVAAVLGLRRQHIDEVSSQSRIARRRPAYFAPPRNATLVDDDPRETELSVLPAHAGRIGA